MTAPIASAALDQLFTNGRTYNAFLDKPVSDETLLEVARLAELGPTEANTLPGRFVFVKSAEAGAPLKDALEKSFDGAHPGGALQAGKLGAKKMSRRNSLLLSQLFVRLQHICGVGRSRCPFQHGPNDLAVLD